MLPARQVLGTSGLHVVDMSACRATSGAVVASHQRRGGVVFERARTRSIEVDFLDPFVIFQN